MKIATFNTNSIRARMPVILEWLQKEQPDLLCLQETKVQDKDFPVASFSSAGYSTVFRGQKSYNGVAAISKFPLSHIRTDLYAEGDEQARFLSGRYGDMSFINIYVPQGFAVGTEKFIYKLTWLSDLLKHIQATYTPVDRLLILGDFNVALTPTDVYDPEGLRGEVGFHPDEQKILQDFFSWGFQDLLRKHEPEGSHFTFWDYRIPNGFKRDMGWRIDYILATQPLADSSRTIWVDREPRRGEKPSDHTFLVAEFDDK